jgi:osmotically-inducible protein OsmY
VIKKESIGGKLAMRYRLATFFAVLLISATALAQVLAVPENRKAISGTEPQARISRQVMHELLMNPYYDVFDNVAYSVNGDNVTLTGQVTRAVVKSDAEAAVRHIEGVESVTNNIKVLPPSSMDDQIRREVYYTVFGFGGLGRYSWGTNPSIHFIVDNGRLTLVGVVDNEGDRNIAGLRANTVPGVFSVTNELKVASRNKQS